MLYTLYPKVLFNLLIPALMFISALAQQLGMIQAYARYVAQLTLVAATVTGWLAQSTELLFNMVRRPLVCDTRDQPSLFFSVFVKKLPGIETDTCFYYQLMFFFSFISSFPLHLEVPLFHLLWCKIKLTTYMLLLVNSLVANVGLLEELIDTCLILFLLIK